MTTDKFITLVYQRDALLPDVEKTALYTLIDRAIVNVRSELKTFEPHIFEKRLTNVTIPSTGYEIPDEAVYHEEQVNFYPANTEGQAIYPLPTNVWRAVSGKWYCDRTPVDIVYMRDLPRIGSDVEGSEDKYEFPFKKRKSEEIILSQTMALIYQYHEENEATDSSVNALNQANRVR